MPCRRAWCARQKAHTEENLYCRKPFLLQNRHSEAAEGAVVDDPCWLTLDCWGQASPYSYRRLPSQSRNRVACKNMIDETHRHTARSVAKLVTSMASIKASSHARLISVSKPLSKISFKVCLPFSFVARPSSIPRFTVEVVRPPGCASLSVTSAKTRACLFRFIRR